SALFRSVPTLFVSNTYPVHTSVATGVHPNTHKLIANTEPAPVADQVWISEEKYIKAQTVWQAAKERGIETASVFWPVTAGSRSIRWNIPEVLARPGKSQLLTSLKAGSPLLQLRLFLRHRKLLRGTKQPNLDNFATACMVDILKEHKPGLALIHLTAFDALCHAHGKGSQELEAAREALERNLNALLNAAGERDVLIFSDHSQINVHTVVVINRYIEDGYVECCGGSAFYHLDGVPSGSTEKERGAKAKAVIEQTPGFRRFLTDEEMEISGYGHAAFGFCAEAGYCYETHEKAEKANHGYPPDMPNYQVFYMAKGFGLPPGEHSGGSLLDIAGLVMRRMAQRRSTPMHNT
ncbi:MAG: alkaline phosphatase family protein, partial [Spirochaetaceae bacterium]|nr:alkaline phosphatase family protein [Spirochaetaceae bacterium]